MKYAMVTTISTFHHRYIVPIDQLQELNPDAEANAHWLTDSVVCEEVEEFSQKWLGEQIISVSEVDDEEALRLFDEENQYLKDWTKEQKLNYMQTRMMKDKNDLETD